MSAPGFFSASFHRDFFLPLVFRSFSARQQASGATFAHHAPLELPVLFVVAIAASAIGLPPWLGGGSIVWGIVGLAGAAGVVTLAATSIGTPPNRDDIWSGFMVPTFCVCVFLGLTVGLFVGAVVWKTTLAKVGFSAAGIACGYVMGIGAGLGMQWLGWMGRLMEVFAIPAIVGLAVLDIVLAVV